MSAFSDVSPRRLEYRDQRVRDLGARPPWWRPIKRARWHRLFKSAMALDVSMYAEWLSYMYPEETIGEMSDRRHPFLLSKLRKETP